MAVPVVLIGQDSLEFAALYQELEKEDGFNVELWARNFTEALQQLRAKSEPVLVVADLGWSPQKALAAAEEIKLKIAHAHMAMTSPQNDPQTILAAMRSGAEEFLPQPFQWPEVRQSLERLRLKIDLEAKNMRRGKTIAVFSSKGGAGCSTVTVNLAVALAAEQKSVCLLDMAGRSGSAATFLNLTGADAIRDPKDNPKAVESFPSGMSLLKHGSGVSVLAGGAAEDLGAKTEAIAAAGALDRLAQSFDFVLVDSRKELDDCSLTVLDKADLILLVTEMDVPSLKSAQKVFDAFNRLGIYDKKVRLVLNRHVKSKIMTVESAEQALGVRIFWTIPNDYPTALAALTRGTPILTVAQNSALAKSYRGFAEAVMRSLSPSDRREIESTERKPGLLSRWLAGAGAAR